jgi:hypothetical protein
MMLNLLFRYTRCPRGGDSDNISDRARNLLYQMAPGQPKFNACQFLWNGIIICSHTSSSGCHYGPNHAASSPPSRQIAVSPPPNPVVWPPSSRSRQCRVGQGRGALAPPCRSYYGRHRPPPDRSWSVRHRPLLARASTDAATPLPSLFATVVSPADGSSSVVGNPAALPAATSPIVSFSA